MGRWEEALEYANKARRLKPRASIIYTHELGYTRMCLRRFDEAVQDFDQAISLSPHLNDAYILKAHTLVARDGDVSEAKQVMLEMMHRGSIVEAAEATATQSFGGQLTVVALRLFPETWSEILDAFEAGRIERYRVTQPAVIAATHISRAFVFEATGDRQSAIARYDSARVHYERIIRLNPRSAYLSVYRGNLALAYIGLGRCDEAIREGEAAVRTLPISKDAVVGPDQVFYLAAIYMKCGRIEEAIDQIEILLSVPYYLSPGLLRADPIWDPIRTNPRFRRLAEGKKV